MSNTYASSHFHVAIVVMLATASLCIAATTTTDAGNGGGSDADAGRRARAAAIVADLLAVHNDARRAVGVAPLTWSRVVAGYAKSYARSRRGDCALRRSPLFYFGENAFVGVGRRWNATAVTAAWVDEGRRLYDYGSNTCGGGSSPCARYTQVVWRNTTQLGCGRVVCGSGDSLLVCDYFPPGNYGTGRPY